MLSESEISQDHLGHRPHIAMHVAWTRSEISNKVAELGALDMVLVLVDRDHWPAEVGDHGGLCSLLFLHLRERGWYVVDTEEEPDEQALAELDALVGVLLADGPTKPRFSPELRREIQEAADAVRVLQGLVAIRKHLTHYYKVSHDRANDLLPVREPHLSLSVMETLPSGALHSRAVLSSDVRSDAPGFSELLSYPDLHLRKYEGRIGFCGATLMFTGYTVLPDSFRWHMEPNPSNFRLSGRLPEFGRIDSGLRPRRRLSGTFYQLDMGFVGHFGHLMTEVVSRLWGWDQAKSEIPDLKVLFYTKPSNFARPQLELDFFAAYGIAPHDLVWVKRPVWLENVVSATPMWHNAAPHYVHPAIDETWTRLTNGLLSRTSPTEGPRRIFVSRKPDLARRRCHNTPEVEEYFASRGFQIVFPEDLSLAEQARLFSGVEVVAGFGGSAMFNVMHARRMKTFIVLNHEAYDAGNEYMFASILGCEIHYLWSAPDRLPRAQGRDVKAVRSSWSFDFARNKSQLDDILGSL